MRQTRNGAVRRWWPLVVAALAGLGAYAGPVAAQQPQPQQLFVRLADGTFAPVPATVQQDGRPSMPIPTPVEPMQIEQRFIQSQPQAAQPVGQMPFLLNYDVPTLRLRAKFSLQPQGNKRGGQRRKIPAMSVPSFSVPGYQPAPMVVPTKG